MLLPLQYSMLWQLSLMLALMASTLNVSSELFSHYYGKAEVHLSKKRLNRHSRVTVD